MSPFGGGGRSPRQPAAAPRMIAGRMGSQAIQRLKKARGFESNLLTRGLLMDEPRTLANKLGGKVGSKLFENSIFGAFL